MRKRTLITRICLALVAGALWIGALVFFLPKDRWVSKVGVPRDFGDMEFFTSDASAIRAERQALSSSEVTREVTDEAVTFTWDQQKPDRDGFIPRRFESDENRVVTFPDGGTIRLAWAAMGYDPGLSNFPATEPFTPTKVLVRGDTWEELDDDAFRLFQEKDLKLPVATKPYFPTLQPGQFYLHLSFLNEGLPDFRPVGGLFLMNYDTMTRVSYEGASNFSSSVAGEFHAKPHIRIYYPARLGAGFDLAYGPCEEVRLPFLAGSRAKLPPLEIEIIAIERLSSSEQRGRTMSTQSTRETRRSEFVISSSSSPRTAVLFSLSHPELGRYCDLVLVNQKDEKETFALDRVESLSLSHVFTLTPPEDIKEVILRYRPNHARVVFELPPLRGIPEVNQEIDNLFDVTVPHLTARSGEDLKRIVTNQAGVQFEISNTKFPENYFPRHYENVTARELLEEYLAHHPEGSRVQLDPITHYLSIPEPFSLKASWKKLKKWAGI